MLELWQGTGPLAYLIVPIGALSLLLAVLYLRNRRRDTFALTVGVSITNLLLGVLAFVSGAHRALGPVGRLDASDRWLVTMGISEALSCLIISLVFAVVASALLTVGAYRASAAEREVREPVTA